MRLVRGRAHLELQVTRYTEVAVACASRPKCQSPTRPARAIGSLLVGWLLLTAAITAVLAVWTLVRGGQLHRIRICNGLSLDGGDANVFALGLLAGAISLIAVIGYWALGAQSVRWRWVRVIAVAVLALPIGLTILVLNERLFTIACM